MVGKSSLQEITTLAIIQETLIWRPGGTVQSLEFPGLSERVDSTEKKPNEAALCFRFCWKKFSTNM